MASLAKLAASTLLVNWEGKGSLVTSPSLYCQLQKCTCAHTLTWEVSISNISECVESMKISFNLDLWVSYEMVGLIVHCEPELNLIYFRVADIKWWGTVSSVQRLIIGFTRQKTVLIDIMEFQVELFTWSFYPVYQLWKQQGLWNSQHTWMVTFCIPILLNFLCSFWHPLMHILDGIFFCCHGQVDGNASLWLCVHELVFIVF
jgi:hypothetical protein